MTDTANPPVTFTLTDEALQAAIAQGVAAVLSTKGSKRAKGKGEKKAKQPQTEEQKAANRAKSEAAAIEAAKAAGFKDAKPRINLLTYDKWIENGRRVRKGEKAVKVGAFRLFHLSQTDAIKAEGTVH